MQPGAVLRDAWELYKAHWRHFVPLALVVYAIVSIASLLLGALLGALGAFVALLVGLVGVFWLQAALVEAVADVRDRRVDLSLGETLRRVQPRLGTLIAAGLLAGLGIVLGLVLLIVPGLVLLTWWSLIVPVIVLERTGVTEAFGRSRRLVRGNGWSVFGVIVLTLLVLLVVGIVVGIALVWLPDSVQGFVQSLVSNTLTAPFVALAWTLMYYRLREPEPEPEPEPALAASSF